MACSGVIGFNGGSYGLSKGDIGFMRIRLSVVGHGVGCCGVGSMSSCAKKFALRAQNGPKLAFLGVLGEFFRTNQLRLSLVGDAAHFRLATMGVLRQCEALLRRVVGVSEPWMA